MKHSCQNCGAAMPDEGWYMEGCYLLKAPRKAMNVCQPCRWALINESAKALSDAARAGVNLVFRGPVDYAAARLKLYGEGA